MFSLRQLSSQQSLERAFFLRLIISSALVLCFTVKISSAESPIVGSAIDSMEELVSDLSDDELESAIAADKPVKAEREPHAKKRKAKRHTKGKRPNALLALSSTHRAKVWINGVYRGRIGKKKSSRFPVRAGQVKITAKGDNGVVRRYLKKIKKKSQFKAKLNLNLQNKKKISKSRKRRK